MSLNKLTIVTITFNNEDELVSTYESLIEFRANGGTHIIINGGRSVETIITEGFLFEEEDKGIYDALNKGISKVQTEYFMLIHSGDSLVCSISSIEDLINEMEKAKYDLMLNDCSIEFGKGKRLMKSKRWQPWMFNFGAQPPHPPTIYRTSTVASIKYDLTHPVIADYKYLEDIFKTNITWGKGNKMLVHMSAGGATSSGIRSFFYVNKQFRKLKGPILMIWFALTRPFIKVYQMK